VFPQQDPYQREAIALAEPELEPAEQFVGVLPTVGKGLLSKGLLSGPTELGYDAT